MELNPPVNSSMRELDRLTNVIKAEDGDDIKRLLLLDVADPDQLPVETREYLNAQGARIVPHSIELDYDYWTADQILRAVLPPELGEGSPTASSINGHIAHMNLSDEYLPYRHLIGQVILDKNKTIRTVVNKLDIIDTELRFFKMEVLAGEPDFIIKHACPSSLLAHEHERLVNLFIKGDSKPDTQGTASKAPHTPLIADVFAGGGPFAAPAAKRGAIVYANDLNQESTKWMEVDVKDNKVVPRVRISTLDGRQFSHDVVQTAWTAPFPPEAYIKPTSTEQRPGAEQQPPSAKEQPAPGEPPLDHESRHIDHLVMNLPGPALEFLDAFRPAFTVLREKHGEEVQRVYATMPMVHVNCFTREPEERKMREKIFFRERRLLLDAQ